MHRNSLFWGLAFIFFGGVLLLQNMGLLPPNFNVWSLIWPAVLIFFGARMLMRSTGVWPAGLDSNRIDDGRMSTSGRYSSERGEVVRLPLGEARRASLRFHHGAGELRVDGNAAPDELLSGTFAGGLEHTNELVGDEAQVDLRVPMGSFPIDPSYRLDWTVGINPNIPLALDMELGASRNWLDLRNLVLKELRLQTGASATEIIFPARAGETRATVKSGAASVQITIPANVSVRIHAHGGMASINLDTARFPQNGGGSGSGFAPTADYCSPDYEVSANRLDLDVETGMGSVTIR